MYAKIKNNIASKGENQKIFFYGNARKDYFTYFYFVLEFSEPCLKWKSRHCEFLRPATGGQYVQKIASCLAMADCNVKPDPQGNAQNKSIIKIINDIIYALQPRLMLFAFLKNLGDEVNLDF